MKDTSNEPAYGCAHGSSMDETLHGLTKFEHFFAIAIGACAYDVPVEKAVERAYQCAERAIKRLGEKKEKDKDASGAVPALWPNE